MTVAENAESPDGNYAFFIAALPPAFYIYNSGLPPASVHHVLGCERHVGAVLHLQYGRRLDHLRCMPLSLGYLHDVIAD